MRLDPADETDFTIADDVFVKHIPIPVAGSIVPQHAHCYDHVTFVASGAIYAWADGKPLGKYAAPRAIVIKAGVKHIFQTLEHDTVILCIHNAARPDVAAVVAENTPSLGEVLALERTA